MSDYVLELPPFTDETTSAGNTSVPFDETPIDHTALALNRLVQQFRRNPLIEKLVRAFCDPMAELEQAFVDIIVKRYLENAVGDQLKQLARLVGQVILDGLSDEDLKRYVRARILANRSNGRGEDLIKITRLVVNDSNTRVKVRTIGNATAALELENNPTNFDIGTILYRDFLSKAVGVGIRITLTWWPDDETEMFEFESFVPGEGVGKGWGSSLDAGVGGKLASSTG